jgi:hypothetical protein
LAGRWPWCCSTGGVSAAGAAIDPGPVKGGLNLPVSAFKSAAPALERPGNRHKAVMLTPEEFHYAFTNTMTDEESAAVYERYAVPGPRRAGFQGALANFDPHAATKIGRISVSLRHVDGPPSPDQ